MCSVKMRPKPGLARRRSRSAAGTRRGTRLTWNFVAEVPELTCANCIVGRRRQVAGYEEAESCDPASREEGRGSWLKRAGGGDRNGHRHRVQHRGRLRRKLEPRRVN